MKLPEYVTKEEVRRVCKELKLRDWTKIKDPKITLQEAKIVLRQIDIAGLKIDPEQFRIGLEVELEHGTRFSQANITNNPLLLPARWSWHICSKRSTITCGSTSPR